MFNPSGHSSGFVKQESRLSINFPKVLHSNRAAFKRNPGTSDTIPISNDIRFDPQVIPGELTACIGREDDSIVTYKLGSLICVNTYADIVAIIVI